ncbi:hypothetical protein V6R21_25085 [Limibacter armeniacum]|uniref:hypothetical protein n=1 Tax=Limibacter armeniacum TaxID=466084 RepID=UPI002FE65F5D
MSFISALPPQEQLSKLQTVESFSEFIEKLKGIRKELVFATSQSEYQDAKDDASQQRRLNQLQSYEQKIATYTYNRDNATSSTDQKKWQIEINTAEAAKEKVLFRLEQGTSDDILDTMDDVKVQWELNSLDEFAVAICQEFEKGGIGAGSVVYNEVTYTAN